MEIRKPWKRNILFVAMLSISGTMTGCIVDIEDAGDDDKKMQKQSKEDLPEGANLADLCTDEQLRQARYDEEKRRLCFQNEEYRWRPSCKSSACQEVPVYVHYMLANDLGAERTVAVEAFDNPNFHGTPKSTVQLTSFDASEAGKFEKTIIYLEPGEYYLRAFVAREDEAVSPYAYQDMELVGDRPLGVHGALSSPEVITVKPRDMEHWANPIHIKLDKLFQKPGTGPGTKAFLRINFEVAQTDKIPEARTVVIQLLEDSDINANPQATFNMPTENLLISSHMGKAEFLTPEVNTGTFVVFAFLDANGNGFYDAGELSQLHSLLGEPRAVTIRANRTTPISLALTESPAIP